MIRRIIIYLIGSCTCWMLSISFSYGQSSTCPPNIDFSFGSFDNWECRTGIVSGNGGTNTVTWLGTGEVADRHQLIAPNSRQTDPYGKFPKHCPGSNSYSVQLGNDNNGHQAEGIFYTYTIPANNNKFSFLFNYAIVMQNPGHNSFEQPRFRARVIDVATGTEINCVSFDFSSSGTLPGFKPTIIGDAIYKDWTPVSVDLSGYAGKTIRLEFITSDCVFQEHFGYAYISVGSVCNGSIIGNNYCEGDSTTKVTAPYGFQSYRWYADNSFTQLLSRSQELQLNISTTPVGSVLPVIINPYPGYGCTDTLYAIIGSAQKPLALAGPDKISCSKIPVQLGVASSNNYSFTWTPDDKLLNPFVSNPFTVAGIQSATDFIVKTSDLLTGCSSFDTVTVTPLLVDTAATLTGGLVYCPGETVQTTLAVGNAATSVQWFLDQTPIPGATTQSYEPAVIGTYWAEIKQFGCVDSSRLFIIRQAPLPRPDFIMSKEIQCLNEPVIFTNKTTIPNNEPINYEWRFGDGLRSQTVNAEKTYQSNGIYTTTLIATSGTDCVDSIQKQVMIINDCVPILPTAFTPNNDGRNDNLKPFLVGVKALKRFSVYNRWGNLVFTSTREGEGWDGSDKGVPLATNVFVWVIEYITKDGQTVTKKGTVTLIR